MNTRQLTPEEVEASLVNKKTEERRSYCRDDVDQTVENIGIARIDLVFVHQKDTVRNDITVW